MFPHALTVYPSQPVTDTDGNTVRRPVEAGTPALGYVQPVSTAETTDGQVGTARYRAYLEASTPFLDASARLVWAGRAFELVGPVLWWADPDASVSYWRAELHAMAD